MSFLTSKERWQALRNGGRTIITDKKVIDSPSLTWRILFFYYLPFLAATPFARLVLHCPQVNCTSQRGSEPKVADGRYLRPNSDLFEAHYFLALLSHN